MLENKTYGNAATFEMDEAVGEGLLPFMKVTARNSRQPNITKDEPYTWIVKELHF